MLPLYPVPHHEDVYASGCFTGHTSAIYGQGNNQMGKGGGAEMAGLNFSNTSHKSYCVKGCGWGLIHGSSFFGLSTSTYSLVSILF